MSPDQTASEEQEDALERMVEHVRTLTAANRMALQRRLEAEPRWRLERGGEGWANP